MTVSTRFCKNMEPRYWGTKCKNSCTDRDETKISNRKPFHDHMHLSLCSNLLMIQTLAYNAWTANMTWWDKGKPFIILLLHFLGVLGLICYLAWRQFIRPM